MKVQVVGFEMVSYVSKKTGKDVHGFRIHYTEPIPEEFGEGFRCRSDFLSDRVVTMNSDSIQPGKLYDLAFNRYGNIESVRLADAT